MRPTAVPWLPVLALLGCFAWVYWPITAADFVIDDYVYLATSRLVDAPWSAFWNSHFYEPYYFRPTGLVSWWYATAWFGLDYLGHSLINLVLHALCVLLLASLLSALDLPRRAIVLGAAMLALGPAVIATVQWPSDRFDVLALLFSLLCARLLLALANSPPRPVARLAWAGMLLSAVLACFSKELAYPLLGALAVLAVIGPRLAARLRLPTASPGQLGGAHRLAWEDLPLRYGLSLLVVVCACFAWRHHMVPLAYAALGMDPVSMVTVGLQAWSRSFLRYSELAMGGSRGVVLMALLGLLLLVSVAWALLRPAPGSGRRLLLLAVLLLVPAAMVAQLSLAGPFSFMLNGEALGTLTYARFYFMPWSVLAVVFAVAVAALPKTAARAVAIGATATLVLAASWQRPLGEQFASWSGGEIRALSVAATEVFDQQPVPEAACAKVLLGSQAIDPPAWFARFADATVKARSTRLERIAHCHTLTEMTPYIFVLPEAGDPQRLELDGLRPIIHPDGRPKVDEIWSGVRYRYRLPPPDWAALPGLRYYAWRDGRFTEITALVRAGERPVPSLGWGF